jgi:hypothetical protein
MSVRRFLWTGGSVAFVILILALFVWLWNTPASSDVWRKLATVATLAASLTALAVAGGPLLWRRYWGRPKLVFTVNSEEPWARIPLFDGHRTRSKFLRAEVRNVGRSEATNVRAVVQRWYEQDSTEGFKPIDPSALHWVSLPWGLRHHANGKTERRHSPPSVNLAPGLYDFVDLVRYDWGEGAHSLLLDIERPRGFDLNAQRAEGDFWLAVVIVADNATSLTRFVHYTVSSNDPYVTVADFGPLTDGAGPEGNPFVGTAH